ncbi:MAG: FAD binding domain-containing protein [Bdellovibrionota bacterium]
MRKTGLVYINGKRHEIGAQHASTMLADYLRLDAGLTGTKIVCAEGDCGACTVLRAFPAQKSSTKNSPAYLPVNSCIMTMAQLDGSSLVTVDALASEDVQTNKLTPVQNSMMKCHGSQCGFCTPGFVMALTGLVEKKLCSKLPTAIGDKEAKNATTGNLCRCTGYQPIIEAAVDIDVKSCESVEKKFSSRMQTSELKKAASEPLTLESESFGFYAPTKMRDAVAYLKRHPETRLIAAATDMGVFHNKWKKRLDRVLSLHLVPELFEIKTLKSGEISVGSRVSLSELREFVKTKVPEFARFLDLFASPQIKNVATLIGNVANASPIADTPPFLLVSNAVVSVVGPTGTREIPIEKFFLGYRKIALAKGELITSIRFSAMAKNERLSLKKVSERKDLDISAVNAAFRMRLDKKSITEVKIAFGGIAATPVRLLKTEKVLIGKKIDSNLIASAVATLQSEIAPIADVRGTAAFRRVLAENLVRRFLSEAAE